MSKGQALSRGMVKASNGLVLGTIDSPARTFNTTFTPSTTRPTMCIYTVQIESASTVAAGDDGTITLVSDTGAPPTTTRCSFRNSYTLTLGIAIAATSIVRGVLTYIVPAGHNVRLNTATGAGTPVFTLISSTEETL